MLLLHIAINLLIDKLYGFEGWYENTPDKRQSIREMVNSAQFTIKNKL
jgi:hypothetical protein